MKLKLSILTLSVLAIAMTVAAKDIPEGKFAGTWKMNPAKSSFPGKPPQSELLTIKPDGFLTLEEVNSEGKTVKWSYKPSAGEPVSVQGRDATVTVNKIDAYTTDTAWKFPDGTTSKGRGTVSKDGKTQTFTVDGTGKDGKPFHEVVVYDKQ